MAAPRAKPPPEISRSCSRGGEFQPKTRQSIAATTDVWLWGVKVRQSKLSSSWESEDDDRLTIFNSLFAGEVRILQFVVGGLKLFWSDFTFWRL